ncbi:MAG: polysaccharide biosynthesis/export family protein [Gammaproteobacteria bacterium]
MPRILLIFAIFFAGLQNMVLAQEQPAIDKFYRINPGDILQISVWEETSLQKDVLVTPDGRFSFPLAGEILAEGRTIPEIRQEITTRLERYIPGLVVTVTVMQIAGNKIFVIGQVNRAGEYVANHEIDVMQALSMAGGTTPFASLNDITILRRAGDTPISIRFRYRDIENGKRLDQNILLKPGDVVVVP